MAYEIALTPSAVADIAWFVASERRQIADGIAAQLRSQPTTEARNRKPLRRNESAEWELRIGMFRVF